MLGGLGTKAWQYGRNAALGAAEYMTPVLTESQFAEKGVLTPEEFVKAGDMLVLRCPTWQWQAGDPANARPFLPPDKQYLFTRNVPCQRRAASLMSGAEDEHEVDGEAGESWLSAHASHVAKVRGRVRGRDRGRVSSNPNPNPNPNEGRARRGGARHGRCDERNGRRPPRSLQRERRRGR